MAYETVYRVWENLKELSILFLYFLLILIATALVLGGLVFGIYLATIITPIILAALSAAATLPSGAVLFIGILAGITIVETTWYFLGAMFVDANRSKSGMPESELEGWWSVLSLLAGIGLGIYLAVQIAPSIIAALAGVGVIQGLAVFTGIIASFALIGLTIAFLVQPIIIADQIRKISDYIDVLNHWVKSQQGPTGAIALTFCTLAGMACGASLGIYLATLVFPLTMAALTAMPMISVGIATFTAIAVSVGLVTSCYYLLLRAGVFVGGLFGAAETALLAPQKTLRPLLSAAFRLAAPSPAEPGIGLYEMAEAEIQNRLPPPPMSMAHSKSTDDI